MVTSIFNSDFLRIANVLENNTARRIFGKIVQAKVVTKLELSEQITETADSELAQSLCELKKVGLIDQKTALIPQFDRFIITATGLRIARML